MGPSFMRGLVFATALLAVSVVADIVFSGAAHFGKFRIALHGASFTMSALGAMCGFALMRRRHIALAYVALLGAGSGVLASAAVMAAVRMGAFAVLAIALFAGCALVAWLGGKALAE